MVLFPRVIALLIALLVRLLVRAVWSLLINFFNELYVQAALGAADVEDQLILWLHQQLGWQPPPVGPAPAFLGTSQPTRPVDVLLVFLLGLQFRRLPVGGVGEARP